MMNFLSKKQLVLIGILGMFFITLASYKIQPDKRLKNIQALPKDIRYDSLDHLMDYYKFALKVKCNYCHAKSTTKPGKLDMASDDNPMKEKARNMIRMTMEMNAKYMSTIKHEATDSLSVQMVTCITCHRGEARPIVMNMPAHR